MSWVIKGQGSWYGRDPDGTNRDPADNGIQASGLSSKYPSIALLRRDTFKDYFLLVDTKTNRAAIVQHGDYGPSGFTGKKIDINPAAAAKLGLTATDAKFPTGRVFKAYHLSKDKMAALKRAQRIADLKGLSFDGGGGLRKAVGKGGAKAKVGLSPAATAPSPGGQGVAALLAQIQSQTPQIASMPLAAPVFGAPPSTGRKLFGASRYRARV